MSVGTALIIIGVIMFVGFIIFLMWAVRKAKQNILETAAEVGKAAADVAVGAVDKVGSLF